MQHVKDCLKAGFKAHKNGHSINVIDHYFRQGESAKQDKKISDRYSKTIGQTRGH